jgi:hypothetical protein
LGEAAVGRGWPRLAIAAIFACDFAQICPIGGGDGFGSLRRNRLAGYIINRETLE